MKNLLVTITLIFLSQIVFSQPTFTANDTVPIYDTPFRLSINPNFNGNQWSDQKSADIAAGNPLVGTEGVGVRAFRIPLPENFLDFWGYDIRVDAFQHYGDLGILDNTVFLEAPTDEHRDTTMYCPGIQSEMFANIYEPIWDGGANGTPVNDDNYAALYIYRTVSTYKDNVKFWEIWNEPDLDQSGNGWKPQDIAGNWYDNVPDPCDYKLKAPVYHYIRLLRISYEVIKSVDPEAYVTVGGLGYESFLDIILRHTDNPNGGEVTADFPLKGGAYFDVLSYHVYPHLNGSLKYWDNSINGFAYQRHSDAASDGAIGLKDRFVDVLLEYGYDGNTYPEKYFILTETTVPRKKFEDYIGSDAAARNYSMKIQIAAYQNDIRQIAIYQLADQATFDNATSWLEMAGLYEIISSSQPYQVTPNESGIACRTLTQLLHGSTYDVNATNALNLPSNIRGGAFIGGGTSTTDTTYVLWAKTETDESEIASATFTLPQDLNYVTLEKRTWDFSISDNVDIVNNENFQLTGTPTFFKGIIGGDPVATINPDLSNRLVIQPNPFKDFFKITFEINETKNVKLEIYDGKGVLLSEINQAELPQGEHTFLLEESQYFVPGMYFGKLTIEGKTPISFKVLKQ